MIENGFELRAITIRNFSIPPSSSLFELFKQFPNDYISYQNHQIIQISEPKESLSCIYNTVIKRERRKNNCITISTPHMIQTISLVGKPGKFWEVPAQYLFITFLQTKDYDKNGFGKTKDRYCSLVRTIGRKLKQEDSAASFALYYSYDFCDYILFVKNTSVTSHNNLVWQLTMGKSRPLLCIRDTFSFYAISNHHLYEEISSNRQPSPNSPPIMALAARMSIYSSAGLLDVIKGLDERKIRFTVNNVFGRYDIEIRTEPLSFSQVCQFIHCIETAFNDNRHVGAYSPFGGYEFLPYSTGHELKVGRTPTRNPTFVKTLIEQYIDSNEAFVDTRFLNYVNEAKRSMCELLCNGFSTEFVLGTLAPFSFAIKNMCIEKDTTREDDYKLIEDAQRVFNSLNTLTLCMMHGERRFIQAPAFGASYFDIPSKLFAYYAAVIHSVKKCYQQVDMGVKCESELNPWVIEDYQFLMVPDFGRGISVRPIKRIQTETPQKHLCIIYLSEEYFYSPLNAIYLIAQEMAHYIGIRYREMRLKQIIYTISCIMMCALHDRINPLPKSTLDDLYKKKSLNGKLAQVVSDTLLDSYYADCQALEKDPLLLRNIKDYLKIMDYGFALFYDSNSRNSIIEKWAQLMDTHENKEELLTSIIYIQKHNLGEGVSFLSSMHSSKQGQRYNARIISNEIANMAVQFNMSVSKDFWQGLITVCNETVMVFREAFADFRMSQALGSGFSTSTYTTLLDQLVPNSYDFDRIIRHDAVLLAAGKDNEAWFECSSIKGFRENAQYIAIQGVGDYLKYYAAKSALTHDDLSQAVQVFGEDTPLEEQCKYVLKELDNYMVSLVKSPAEIITPKKQAE